MREAVTWFFVGAAVTGMFVGLVARQPDDSEATLKTVAATQAALARQQAELDRRLLAVEQRGSNLAAVPATNPGTASLAGSTEPADLTAEQRRAAETGSGIVQGAIAAGQWTRRDAIEFSGLGDMGGGTRIELQRQLAVAINEDRVKVEPGAEFRW